MAPTKHKNPAHRTEVRMSRTLWRRLRIAAARADITASELLRRGARMAIQLSLIHI